MGEPEILLTLGVATGTFCFFYLRTHYYCQRQLQLHGVEAEGEVVDLILVKDSEHPDDPDLGQYYPLLRFQTRTGAIVTVQYSYNGSLFSYIEWQVGQRLPLLYLPANPRKILLPAHKESINNWLVTGMMLSAAMVVISILAYLAHIRS